MVFGVFNFLQKTNERIRLDYYDTSSQLVFVRFLEEVLTSSRKQTTGGLILKRFLPQLKSQEKNGAKSGLST